MSKEIKLPLAATEGMIREELAGGGSVVLNVRGTSMLPLLKEGATYVRLVSPVFPLKKHQVILYKRRDGQFVLHRILKCKKGGMVCRGDHQAAKEFPVYEDSVIAVMTGYTKGETWVDIETMGQRLLGAYLAKTGRIRLLLRAAEGKLGRMLRRKRT